MRLTKACFGATPKPARRRVRYPEVREHVSARLRAFKLTCSRKSSSRALRITIVVVAVLVLLWWFGMRMPGKNVSKAGPLSPDEVVLREELRANVQKLAGEIGERNMWHYAQLNAAADFIEDSFSRAGLRTRRDSYETRGQPATISRRKFREPAGVGGLSPPPIIVIGAHYDSVFGSPGANDNGSGVGCNACLGAAVRQRKAEANVALRCVRE